MDIKYYYLSDPIWSRAVSEGAALFHLTSLKSRPNLIDGLSQAMVIHVDVADQPANAVRVQVMIEYWREAEGQVVTEKREQVELIEYETKQRGIQRLIRLQLLHLLEGLLQKTPGNWGILRGVRPTKIVHRFLDQKIPSDKVAEMLADMYGIRPDKGKLLLEVAGHQRGVIPTQPLERADEVSVYIGIPYCPSRCLYCSFPSYVLPGEKQVAAFIQAIEEEIAHVVKLIEVLKFQVQTVYIGGGTPTSLPEPVFLRFMDYVCRMFPVYKELTVEAGRPDSLTPGKMDILQRYGVSRVSINPQSMQNRTLQRIGRNHSAEDVIGAYDMLRERGIPCINMDIIAGLPGETIDDMDQTLEAIIRLKPDNLTVHTLAVKRGSLLRHQDDLVSDVSEPEVEGMLEHACAAAREMNMHPYYLYRQKYMLGNLENVGFAKPGKECFYNIHIMEERQTIIGIGPSSATKVVDPANWTLRNMHMPKDVPSYIIRLSHYMKERESLLQQSWRVGKENGKC